MEVQGPDPSAPLNQVVPKPDRVGPRSVSILGILNIVFGGLGFIFNLGSLGSLLGGGSGGVARVGNNMSAASVMWGWGITWSSIGLVASVVLVASGIRLRRRRYQGLRLAVDYALFYGIFTSLIGVAIAVLFDIAPLLAEFHRNRRPEWLAEAISKLIFLVLEVGPTMIYSIILLMVFRRPAVGESLL